MNLQLPFRDRAEAGRILAELLRPAYAGRSDALVLALPRGGVPVGFAVAQTLGLPLDVFLVRKIGVPGFAELAMGAIASGGVRVLNEDVLALIPDQGEALDEVTAVEMEELARRESRYRSHRPPLVLLEKIAILVDDGLATGATMRAAVAAVRELRAQRIVVAIPVGPRKTCEQLRKDADEVICAYEADDFEAVGQYYVDFSQTSDEEVCRLLGTGLAERG